MENLSTASEQTQTIRKGDLVTYNGELWIINNLNGDQADLVDPNNLNNIAPGVPRTEINKGADAISGPGEESEPGKLLEQYCESVGEILEPGYTFSKQGQTFQEASGDFDGIHPERQKILVEQGVSNGYENVIFSDPEEQN